jgi:hypothetical protein
MLRHIVIRHMVAILPSLARSLAVPTARRMGLFLILGAYLTCGAALAESRLALVIGNSNYRSVTPLPNPVNDAKAVAAELTAAGFDVTPALDLGQSDMRRTIRDFAAKIASKGPDAVALVFYAGHGVQVDGENFLVPVDAKIQREADIAIEAVRLADLMNALATVPSRMRIVILDACRNNPFAPTKQTRGLAIVDAPTGSIVAYSTAPGTEATDGAGVNSPYTAAFLEVAKQPRLQIEQVFKQVRLKVHQTTNGQQTPWESSSLTSDFWFLPVEETAPAATVASATPAPTGPVATRLPMPRPASAPPATPVVAAAPAPAPLPTVPAKLAAPQAAAALPPASAALPPLPAALPSAPAAYASAPPPRVSRVADIRRLPADDAYDLVVEEDSVDAYEEFLLLYPYDPRAEWVRTSLALRVDAMAWRYASVVNTPAAYEAYLARYPGGAYADEAVRLKVRPRIRVIDAVIAPRVVVAPPALRIALPLIQMRRPAGGPIVLPVVLSRPGRFAPGAGLAPVQRLPAANPAFAPRVNATPNVVTPNRPSGPTALAPAALRPNAINAAPGPAAIAPARLPGPGALPSGPGQFRQNAINAPAAPTNVPQYRPATGTPPVANVAPQLQPAQPMVRPVNPQLRPLAQRAQIGPNPRPGPARCAGKGCRR